MYRVNEVFSYESWFALRFELSMGRLCDITFILHVTNYILKLTFSVLKQSGQRREKRSQRNYPLHL